MGVRDRGIKRKGSIERKREEIVCACVCVCARGKDSDSMIKKIEGKEEQLSEQSIRNIR